MPTKAKAPTLEEFVLTVLSCSEPLNTNWQKVANAYGYSRAGDT